MTYRILTRRERGLWWWSTGFGPHKRWDGPWRSREEALRKARNSVLLGGLLGRTYDADGVEVAWDGSPLPPAPPPPLTPPTDLRQMAWLWWPELR